MLTNKLFIERIIDYNAAMRADDTPPPVPPPAPPPIVIDARPIEAKVDDLLVRVKALEATVAQLTGDHR